MVLIVMQKGARKHMTSDKIVRTFPEIEGIKSEDLKGKVIKIWQRAIDIGKWDDIEDIPFYPKIPKDTVNLVKHLRAVTNHSLKMAEIMNSFYSYNVNTDFVIAGALLHDVCKAVEYSSKGGKAAIGDLTTHGTYGVHLCLEVGMPVEVTHIVASHTKKMGLTPKIIEAIIVHYCDIGDAQAIGLKNGLDFL